jgi:hypothetical protein
LSIEGRHSEQATHTRSGAWVLLLALFAAIFSSAVPEASGFGRAELRQSGHELAVGPEAFGAGAEERRADPLSDDPPVEQAAAARAAAASWRLQRSAQRLSAVLAVTPTSIGHAFEARGPPRS